MDVFCLSAYKIPIMEQNMHVLCSYWRNIRRFLIKFDFFVCFDLRGNSMVFSFKLILEQDM